jgi:hypothetical protein
MKRPKPKARWIKTPRIKLAFPRIVDPKDPPAKQRADRTRGEAELAAVRKLPSPPISPQALGEDIGPRLPIPVSGRMLKLGGKVVYDSWVREAGYAKNAAIMDYDKLKEHMKARWERIALDVFKAMQKASEQ